MEEFFILCSVCVSVILPSLIAAAAAIVVAVDAITRASAFYMEYRGLHSANGMEKRKEKKKRKINNANKWRQIREGCCAYSFQSYCGWSRACTCRGLHKAGEMKNSIRRTTHKTRMHNRRKAATKRIATENKKNE